MTRLTAALALPLPLALSLTLAAPALADTAADWQATLAAARGQTVYWNAWGGDARTNAFIDWVGDQAERRYGVTVEQVKLTDTAEAVARVRAEQAAGKKTGGSVDLIWINGPNFAAMKEEGLLHGPFVAGLPNARYLDLTPGAPATVDFTVPVEGMESPWRLAKFVLVHDSARAPDMPATMAGLAEWAAANPGRLTHPAATNFMGATFLKQALVELAPDRAALMAPVTDAAYAAQTAGFWTWYDALRPHLWRQGTSFPENQSVQDQLLADGEVDVAMSFDPASTAASIGQGLLPDSARVFVPEAGTIGNVSFVAIPFNAAAKEGAMVVANFLLDPATQAHMQDITVLGSFSVLDPARLDAAAQAAFAALPVAPALPTLAELGPTLPEPHGSWMVRLTEDWVRRTSQ
jgi:putative thiamine transport system substrate-binding protein